MKKKIIFPINSKIYSGLESVAITIIENLKDKFDFIYVTQDGPIVDVLKEKKINYYIIKKMSIKEIRQCVKELNPDIIHAHDYTASCICSLAKINLPIISHLHNNSSWIKTLHPYSFLYLYSSKRFNKILTVSDSIEKEYIFSNFIKDKIENISNPVSRDYILNKVNKNDTKKYDVCFVGRLTKQKNPLKFINIINDVKNVIPNIKAVMIGDGKLKESCKKLIEDLGLKNNIELLGFKKNPYQYMNQSNIFCLTSEWEGYGLVAFEALTLGLPCVVSRVGGLVNIVDEECGYLVSTEDEFKNTIIDLIYNKEIFYKKSQKSIEKSIELENIEVYCDKIEKIYNIERIIENEKEV